MALVSLIMLVKGLFWSRWYQVGREGGREGGREEGR
jgi:hypothetical protein